MARSGASGSFDLVETLRTAFALMEAGQLDKALMLVEGAERRTESHTDVLHLKALIFKRQGRVTDSINYFERALKTAPRNQEILCNFAALLTSVSKLDLAAQKYMEAIQINPQMVRAWLGLGNLFLRAGKYTDAEAVVSKALGFHNKNAHLIALRGAIAKAQGLLPDAISHYNLALELQPNNKPAHINLSVLYNIAGQYQRALEHLSASETVSKETRLCEATCYAGLGEFESSHQKFLGLLRDCPDYVEAHNAYARFLWEQGSNRDFSLKYEEAVKRKPADTNLRRGLVKTLFDSGNLEDALQVLNAVDHSDKERPDVLSDFGLIYAALGEIEKASKYYEAAIHKESNAAGLRTAFAYTLLKAGQPDKAAEQAERAVGIDPYNQHGWAYASLAWRLLGDERYFWLNDYEKCVVPVEVDAPTGFKNIEEFNSALRTELEAIHLSEVQPLDQSLRGGTQTNGSLFLRQEPLIQKAYGQINFAIKKALDSLPIVKGHPFLGRNTKAAAFVGSWSVLLRKDGHHINHVHEKGWMSSAYYVSVDGAVSDNADRPEGWIQFGVPPKELNLDLQAELKIQPVIGQLVLFPSYMWHGTVPFSRGHERMTIAFDVQPR
ncbi:MAG: tetratricopeptide repeat protein [Sphingomonadales bacterium]